MARAVINKPEMQASSEMPSFFREELSHEVFTAELIQIILIYLRLRLQSARNIGRLT
jgi:hypothetical protein